PTLEWSIPSPVPEYNFAKLPTVTSRYPMWDLKSPLLTEEVPHSRSGDERVDVAAFGSDTGAEIRAPAGNEPQQPREAATAHIETETFTAAQLGIPMPSSTIKPLLVSAAMTVMFSGMFFLD